MCEFVRIIAAWHILLYSTFMSRTSLHFVRIVCRRSCQTHGKRGQCDRHSPELAKQMGVAQMTIRRDLDVICQSPGIQRVHGGAIRTLPAVTGNTLYQQRLHTNQKEKTAIARHISSLVSPGETLYLGAGTTTWYVAQALADIPRLTVMTNSLQIAALLGDHSRLTVIVVGGILNREEFSLVGNFARQDVHNLRLDKAIMSIRGVHPVHGLTSELTPDSDQSFMENSSNIIIAADHTKFGAVAANQLSPPRADPSYRYFHPRASGHAHLPGRAGGKNHPSRNRRLPMTIYTSLQSPVNHVPLGSTRRDHRLRNPDCLPGHCGRDSQPPEARSLRSRYRRRAGHSLPGISS